MAFPPFVQTAFLRLRRAARWAPPVLSWAAALACLAGAAQGDWLVTHDGHRIETEGPWRVEGKRVLFHSVGGTLQSIELSEVDLELSRQLTETLRGQPRLLYPRPVIRRTGESRVERQPRLQRDEVAIAAPSAPDVYVPVREPDGIGGRFEASIRLGATSHDNFFQADDDEPPTEMTTGEAAALLSWRLAPGSRQRAFLEATRTELENLPASDALRFGLRLGNRRHTFHLSSRLQRGFKVQDLDDEEPEEVERRTFLGDYQLHPGRAWRLELAGELQRLTTPSRDADSVELAAALRYRGLDRFSPEVGILWAENDGVRDNRDYEERGLFLKLRFFPADRLAFELRGRQREREYTIPVPEASNFGRRDTRRDWSLGAHVLLVGDVVLSLRYELVENESSRDRRSFSGNRLGLGLSFTFGGGRGRADHGEPSPRPPSVLSAAELEEAEPPAPAAGAGAPPRPAGGLPRVEGSTAEVRPAQPPPREGPGGPAGHLRGSVSRDGGSQDPGR